MTWDDIKYESPELDKLGAALAKAQGKFPAMEKDKEITLKFYNKKTNEYQSNKIGFMSLGSLIKNTTPALSEFGLSVSSKQRIMEGNIFLVTRLLHESGQWMDSWAYLAPIGLGSDDQQNFGKAKSYQRRYELSSILNLFAADETDNDGNDLSVQPIDKEPKKENKPLPKAEASTASLSLQHQKEILTVLKSDPTAIAELCVACNVNKLSDILDIAYNRVYDEAKAIAEDMEL